MGDEDDLMSPCDTSACISNSTFFHPNILSLTNEILSCSFSCSMMLT